MGISVQCLAFGGKEGWDCRYLQCVSIKLEANYKLQITNKFKARKSKTKRKKGGGVVMGYGPWWPKAC